MRNLSNKKKIKQRHITCQRKLDIRKLDLNRLKILKKFKNFNQLKNPKNLNNLIRIISNINRKSHRAMHRNTIVKRFNKHKSCFKLVNNNNSNNNSNNSYNSNNNTINNNNSKNHLNQVRNEIDLFTFDLGSIFHSKKISITTLKKLKNLCKQVMQYEYRKTNLISFLKHIKNDSLVSIKYASDAVPDELSLPYSIGKESTPINIFKTMVSSKNKNNTKLRILAYKILKNLVIKKRLELISEFIKEYIEKQTSKKKNPKNSEHATIIVKQQIRDIKKILPSLHLKYMILVK